MSYNPKPTRVWSRVQNPCTFTLDISYNSVFSPLTGKTTSLLEADYYNKLIYKGNILQYKKNTSNLFMKCGPDTGAHGFVMRDINHTWFAQ